MTPEQTLKLMAILIPSVAAVLIAITFATWHYWHFRGIRDHAADMRRRELDAAQEKIDKEAEDARQMKEIEVRAAHEQQQWDDRYDEALKDISTKYALYCPGCGKIMTLQHASRLPAEMQAQMMYVPPPEEPEEPEKRRKRK